MFVSKTLHYGICTFFVYFIASMLYGADIPIPGDFRASSPKDGMPNGWTMHTWEGYAPFPHVECAPEGPSGTGAEGTGAVILSEIHGKDGGAIQTREHYPARSGDSGRVTFFARGRGEMWVTFYRWGEKNQWNGVVTASRIRLTEMWQPQEITLPVDDGHACQTASVSLAICGLPGSEIHVSNMKLDLQKSGIAGDLRLPKTWMVFVPVSSDFTPSSSDFVPSSEMTAKIPETFAGVRARRASFVASKLCFTEDSSSEASESSKTSETFQHSETSESSETSPASTWFFAEMDAPYDCDFTFRARTSKLIRLFLNGEEVRRSPSEKSGESPVTVRLLKGKNVFALQTSLADGAAGVTLEGPSDLRSGHRVLKLQNAVITENFDGPKLSCTGNPKRIQGVPTPGLLAVTGQGVFQTRKSLNIQLPSDPLTLSGADDSSCFAVGGLRIQTLAENSVFEIRCENAASEGSALLAVCRLIRSEKSDWSEMQILRADGTPCETFPIANRLFPADFLFGVNAEGRWTLFVSSLVDSQAFCREGTLETAAPQKVKFDFRLCSANALEPENSEKSENSTDYENGAEITVDNLVLGTALWTQNDTVVPFKIDVFPSFDPVKAGWKCVFSEDFDSDRVDLSKWYFSSTSVPEYAKVHDGLLEIVCDWNAKKTDVESASLYTNDTYGYGYYEARVKFRQQSGWWSAFWLCTHGPSNPFVDGWEIDIYEDYYMGPQNPGEPPRAKLDHNLHVFACGTLRSWNYNSLLPGSVDDFYVVGCKWTPFEVSYYLNGKLIRSEANHSPYDSVTFDPFSHAAGFQPLHAILSGCCGRSGGDPKLGTFPESFFVDYVRIYEFPQDSQPVVTWSERPDPSEFVAKPGQTLRFTADVKPSAKTGAKIQTVYLFDSGALLDFKTEPPYTFEVPITREYYDKTNYVKPGRTGIRPDFDRGLHAYAVFAQDERGEVGHSEPVLKLMRKAGAARPYLGKMHELPGTISLAHYDEGGQGIAYSDSTPENVFSSTFRPGESVDTTGETVGGVSGGEWLKFTVQISETGKYVFRFTYGTPSKGQRGPQILLDGKILGEFQTPPHEFPDWRTDSTAEITCDLPAGEHELLLFMQGSYNIQNLSAEKAVP